VNTAGRGQPGSEPGRLKCDRHREGFPDMPCYDLQDPGLPSRIVQTILHRTGWMNQPVCQTD